MRHYTVTGEVEYEVTYYCDYHDVHHTEIRRKEINHYIKARNPEWVINDRIGDILNNGTDESIKWVEWKKGPHIVEIPEDEYMRLIHAPVLFTLA